MLRMWLAWQQAASLARRALNGALGEWYMRSYSNNLLFGVVVLTTLKVAHDFPRVLLLRAMNQNCCAKCLDDPYEWCYECSSVSDHPLPCHGWSCLSSLQGTASEPMLLCQQCCQSG